ncbi:MAG: hypothetical protein GY852_12050, partial [bacterium]|nr:hypothetical protein [bacterium]
ACVRHTDARLRPMEKPVRVLCERAMAREQEQHSHGQTTASDNRRNPVRILDGEGRNHVVFQGIAGKRGEEAMEWVEKTCRALEILMGGHMTANCIPVHQRL